MLAEEGRMNFRWQLFLTVGILCLVAILALLWPDVGVGESLSPTQTPAQDVVWRECNPTLEAMREDTLCSDNPTPVQGQNVVWRECNPTLEAMGDKVWSWDIPTPTPTPRIRICDCILKQVATPVPTPTPRIIEK